MLPVEFARQSKDGRITLVIANNVAACPVLWAKLQVKDLGEAVQALAKRESVPNLLMTIGRWPANNSQVYPQADGIAKWAESKGLAGVVWTALKPGLKSHRGKTPALSEIVKHLCELEDEPRTRALEYVQNAPRQIRTPYRSALESMLKLGGA